MTEAEAFEHVAAGIRKIDRTYLLDLCELSIRASEFELTDDCANAVSELIILSTGEFKVSTITPDERKLILAAIAASKNTASNYFAMMAATLKMGKQEDFVAGISKRRQEFYSRLPDGDSIEVKIQNIKDIWRELLDEKHSPLERWRKIMDVTEPKRNAKIKEINDLFEEAKKNEQQKQNPQGCLLVLLSITLFTYCFKYFFA
jgi:hypothetical protein